MRKPAMIVAGIVVALALAAGGVFVGRATVDKTKIRRAATTVGLKSGYEKGYADGLTRGSSIARADYKQGHTGYATIYHSGYLAGQSSGLQSGRSQGVAAGFDGYDGGWSVGRWYIVEIGSGSEVGLPGKYSLKERVGPMTYGKGYSLCDDGDGICG